MVTINDELWNRLRIGGLATGEYQARRPNPRVDFYLAVARDGSRHFLVGVSSRNEWFRDDRSRGLSVQGKELHVEGEPVRPFLVVTCTDRNGYDAFNVVAREVMERVSAGESPSGAVKTTLERWRRFWGNATRGPLSEEAVRGLFGELWFLSVWVLPHGADHLHSWVGPTGSRHDFQWPHQSVEVKATASSRGHVHVIHGLEQLETPDAGQLLLFSLQLRAEPSSSNSLVSLIRRVEGQLRGQSSLQSLFEDRLVKAGYSPAYDEHYDQLRFRVVDERLYEVGDGFPRIVRSSFATGVAPGVESVSYTVNLDVCTNLCIARSPSEDWRPPTHRIRKVPVGCRSVRRGSDKSTSGRNSPVSAKR